MGLESFLFVQPLRAASSPKRTANPATGSRDPRALRAGTAPGVGGECGPPSPRNPGTHPSRRCCPRCATPPGSGRRGSPHRASENLEPGGARLWPGCGCGCCCCCCFLVLSSPSGGEREPAEAGAGGTGGGGGRDAKAGASRTGRSCSPGRLSGRPRRRGEPRALQKDDREPSSPPRARSPAPLLSTSGERAGGKEGRGRSLRGGGMAGRRGLGRCFSPELPPRPWQRRGLP